MGGSDERGLDERGWWLVCCGEWDGGVGMRGMGEGRGGMRGEEQAGEEG